MKFDEFKKQLDEADVVSFDKFRQRAAQKQGRDIAPEKFEAPKLHDDETLFMAREAAKNTVAKLFDELPTPFKMYQFNKKDGFWGALGLYRQNPKTMPPHMQEEGERVKEMIDMNKEFYLQWARKSYKTLFTLFSEFKDMDLMRTKTGQEIMSMITGPLFDVDQFIKEVTKLS